MTNNVGFFDPVKINNNKIHNSIENYFYLEGISNTLFGARRYKQIKNYDYSFVTVKERNNQSPSFSIITALKIASWFTIVTPILFLIVKIYERNNHYYVNILYPMVDSGRISNLPNEIDLLGKEIDNYLEENKDNMDETEWHEFKKANQVFSNTLNQNTTDAPNHSKRRKKIFPENGDYESDF